MAKKRYYESRDFYSGIDARRRLEYEDGAMIREDRSAVANLPQQVIMREFPRESGYLPEGLNDTIRGVDEQMDADNRKKMQYLQPEKY